MSHLSLMDATCYLFLTCYYTDSTAVYTFVCKYVSLMSLKYCGMNSYDIYSFSWMQKNQVLWNIKNNRKIGKCRLWSILFDSLHDASLYSLLITATLFAVFHTFI